MATLIDRANRVAVNHLSQRNSIEEAYAYLDALDYDRLDRYEEAHVSEALEIVLPAIRAAYNRGNQNFNRTFWDTEDGRIIGKAQAWLYKDRLITYSEALEILGINRTQLANILHSKNPKLKIYWVHADRYPPHVDRKEVEAYADELERERHSGMSRKDRLKAIPNLLKQKMTYEQIAEMYGVSHTAIYADTRLLLRRKILKPSDIPPRGRKPVK